MTEDFERWWRDAGQFLQPCDRMSGDELEPFKKFASEAMECMRQPWDDDVKKAQEDAHDAEQEASNAEEELEVFQDRIKEILDNHEGKEALALIQKELNEVA